MGFADCTHSGPAFKYSDSRRETVGTMADWKKKIKKDVNRQEDERKREQRETFNLIYDKPKHVQFKSPETLNMKKHFFMPTIHEGFNFDGNRNEQVVYPVLCAKADFREPDFIQLSRENIAKLSGISTVATDDGLKRLEQRYFKGHKTGVETPFLERELVQDGKRRFYVYNPNFFRPDTEGTRISDWQGSYMVFHTWIIDSGLWAKLHRNSKALYLTMRSCSWFDRLLYEELENVSVPDEIDLYEAGGNDEAYQNYVKRRWEVCDTSLRRLFDLAGIAYNNTNTKHLINDLVEKGLVERLDDKRSVFKVWLKPQDLRIIKKICI